MAKCKTCGTEAAFTEEEMGNGRQIRQNRKENPTRNWTFRLRKMQKTFRETLSKKNQAAACLVDRRVRPRKSPKLTSISQTHRVRNA